MKDRIVSRDDLAREVEDRGLLLVDLDESEAPTVRAVVRAMPPSDVIRRPPGPERVQALRVELKKRGVLGVRWVVVDADEVGGPYRAPGNGG